MYSQKFSLIQTHAASHAAVIAVVIDDRADVIHVTNGSMAACIYDTHDMKVALITSRFVIIIYASHTIAATISHIGDKINHITVANVPNHATIAGIASQSVPTTVTNQAIDQAINIMLPKSSGFSVARDTKLAMTGCTTASNCWKAGAKAPPIASCISPNVSESICCCHSIVFPNASACHPTFSIKAPMISCLLAVSDTSIPYSLRIFWFPASAIVTTFVADHISICFATDRSAANVANFCASVCDFVTCKSLA